MVPKPLAPVDVTAGKRLVQLLRRTKATSEVDLLAAAWLFTGSKEDWRLYLVTRLVDSRSAIYAGLVIYDTMLQHDEFNALQRRLEIVGRRDRYAKWLRNLAPVGGATTLGDLQIDTSPADEGIWSAHIYLSLPYQV